MTNTSSSFRRGRIIVGTIQLKSVLDQYIRTLYPDKRLSEVEVADILSSIISSVLTPIIYETTRDQHLQQATLDLIVFHLPQQRDTMDKAYDIYAALETSLIELVLSTIPQITTEANFEVSQFTVTSKDALILDVFINNAYTYRAKACKTQYDEASEWSVLEHPRF